ncbi:MAG: B12-binding domain-containing radical SAM protein [Candidatus Yanofskybacteria bacterium]|nr:B12-binding domain-containing radical SAM protein [Candidatus Yanofskybacteria bacterium]
MGENIAVVVPFWHYWIDPKKLQPLWELYYATLLRERNPKANVDVIDLRGRHKEEIELPERDIYFYWIMKSADAPRVYKLVQETKRRYPHGIHIAGGNHVDHLTEECSGIFDASIVGSGEELILQALADYRSNKLQSVYRSNQIFHFSSYSFPQRDFLPDTDIVHDKHFAQYGSIPGTSVYFSRGCVFHCSFCVYNNPNRFELRLPEQVTAEIRYLKQRYGVRGVNLRDEVCIPVNRKEATAMFEAIGAENIVWRGQTTPLGTEEILKLARQSGCLELALGVESVESDKVLKLSNKPNSSVDSIRRYIDILKKLDIKVKVCLIFGLPGETNQVVEKTIKFLEEVKPDFVALSGLDVVPGSVFHNSAESLGIKSIEQDLSKHAHLMYRFGDDEEVGLPFEYEKETPWGPSLTREEIANNIKQVQKYLRDRGMSY